jgi:hypothetical protein
MKTLLLALVLLSVGRALGADVTKEVSEQELRLKVALAEEMIARRESEIRELRQLSAELMRQIEELDKKKGAESKKNATP